MIREFTEDDYEIFKTWWDDPPPKTSLPLIGMVSGDMKAVGFLANTDCDFCILTWWHANPLNKGRESYMALSEIIKGIIEAATLINKKHIFCFTQNRGMISLLESFDFINNSGHLIRGVK